MFWVPLLILFLPFSRSDCRGSDCSKFKCSSEPFPPRPLDPYLRPGSTFTTPCSCQPDWNDIFCNLTQYLLSTPTTTSIEHPIVCVCRKFSDNYSKCEQFISRCFHHKNKGCSCCFNQPYQYCNQLSCKNNEPDFSGSNTTCVCHHHPTDYPYQICKAMYARDGTQLQPAAQPVDMEQPKKITLLGISVPITAFLYVIVGLLIAVALLTVIILIAGNRKVSRRREDSSRQRQAAEEALLRQQQEDDRYLPTV